MIHYLFSLLAGFFLSTCSYRVFAPPEPIVVQPPASVTTKKIRNEGQSLLIDLGKAGTVHFFYTAGDGHQLSLHLHPAHVKNMEAAIGSALAMAGRKDQLKVMIKGKSRATDKTFQTVIE